jgi:transcriptional regulator with GAF, ATPase, and Fis domain
VTFNCSNLVESLAESQLFGHVRGAFTDAREDSLGYFRSANGGTLFLDEIGELPIRLQPKLLRAVETHEVQPVGSAQSYKVDIRLIAATNRDLRAMVKAAEFRDDLYYRLSASAINIPPLRERRDALEALAAHFIQHYNRLFDKQVSHISRRALAALQAYEWPGNVREFAHAIQSAIMLTDNDRVCIADLPENLWAGELSAIDHFDDFSDSEAGEAQAPAEPDRAFFSLDAVINKASKGALIRALREAHGNCHRAAQLLGVSRYTVYRMIARYGLASHRGRQHGLGALATAKSDGAHG